MNLTDLIRRARKHLAEAGQASLSDTDFTAELNRSQKALAAETGLLRGVGTFTAGADGVAALPTSVLSVISVYHAARRYYLEPVQQEALADWRGGGQPRWFTYDPAYGGSGLQVWPASSIDVTVVYHHAGAPMVAGIDQPWGGAFETFHDLIALHASYMLGGLNGPSAAKDTVYAQRFGARMDEFKAARAIQVLNTPSMVMRAPMSSRRFRNGW